MTVLQVENLEYQLNETILFHGLSFALEKGHILVVSGENGSGKSTLLKLLAKLILPDSGCILWTGEAICAYLGHLNGLKKDLTIHENLVWAFKILNDSGHPFPVERVKEALTAFHLLPHLNQRIKYLSFGQSRKTALTRVLLQQKQVWLLDEPFVGLDTSSVAYLQEKMYQHCQQGGSIILTNHHDVKFDKRIPSDRLHLTIAQRAA